MGGGGLTVFFRLSLTNNLGWFHQQKDQHRDVFVLIAFQPICEVPSNASRLENQKGANASLQALEGTGVGSTHQNIWGKLSV